MSIWRNLRRGVRGLLRKDAVERELDAEVRDYLDRAIDEQVRSGVPPAEAARAVRAGLGSLAAIKDEVRGGVWEASVERLWQDVRCSVRGLRKHAILSAIVVVTLTFGIGVSSGVFGFFNAILLRARVDRDFASFARIYVGYTTDPARPGIPANATWSDYVALRDGVRTLRDVAAWSRFPAPLGPGESREARGLLVSCNFFALYDLGQAALGRLLQPGDCLDASPVMVISERQWRTRFAADPAIIGQASWFNHRPVTIVGVVRAFAGQIDGAGVWLPVTLHSYLTQGGPIPDDRAWLAIAGRLNPGATRRGARTDLEGIAAAQD